MKLRVLPFYKQLQNTYAHLRLKEGNAKISILTYSKRPLAKLKNKEEGQERLQEDLWLRFGKKKCKV